MALHLWRSPGRGQQHEERATRPERCAEHEEETLQNCLLSFQIHSMNRPCTLDQTLDFNAELQNLVVHYECAAAGRSVDVLNFKALTERCPGLLGAFSVW